MINKTSTERQIEDFLDENRKNVFLVTINGTRRVVWLTGRPCAIFLARRSGWTEPSTALMRELSCRVSSLAAAFKMRSMQTQRCDR